ncbi:MAG: TauD/TfdA family dioxygenase, partial [Pseudomonadota bacterium]|nr:TauD/TfdA family dioxygenase [Pseudomonadota bacterium]
MEHPSFSNIGVTPLSNALGAEIDGVDLSQPLEKAQFEDIQKALCAYGAIGFRNQKLSHQNQIDFALRFGTLEVHPIVKGMEEYPEIIRMHKPAGTP